MLTRAFLGVLTSVGLVMATIVVYFVFGLFQALLVVVLYVGLRVMASAGGRGWRYRGDTGPYVYGDSSGSGSDGVCDSGGDGGGGGGCDGGGGGY